ncbi:MAG: hypothetical protein V3S11_04700 [Elusimicrobiota bacterium]
MRRWILPSTVLAAFLLGCQAAFGPARPSWPPLPRGHFMHVGTFLQVSGTAAPDPKTSSVTQQIALSRDEALADARRRLRRYIAALPLGGGMTAGLRMKKSKEFRRSVEQMIRSAAIVSTEWDDDGTAVVLIRVDKRRINKILGAQFR